MLVLFAVGGSEGLGVGGVGGVGPGMGYGAAVIAALGLLLGCLCGCLAGFAAIAGCWSGLVDSTRGVLDGVRGFGSLGVDVAGRAAAWLRWVWSLVGLVSGVGGWLVSVAGSCRCACGAALVAALGSLVSWGRSLGSVLSLGAAACVGSAVRVFECFTGWLAGLAVIGSKSTTPCLLSCWSWCTGSVGTLAARVAGFWSSWPSSSTLWPSGAGSVFAVLPSLFTGSVVCCSLSLLACSPWLLVFVAFVAFGALLGARALPGLVAGVGAQDLRGVRVNGNQAVTAVSAVGMVAGWRGLGVQGRVVLGCVCGFGPSA